MSFSISVIGKKEAVIREVKETKGYGDTSQLESVKAFIVSELEKAPEPTPYLNGVIVSASGHHDASVRSVEVRIQQVRIVE